MVVIETVRGEDLGGAYPAKVAPVLVIWCPAEAGVVVAKNLASEQTRAVGEGDVVLCETFFGSGRGGDQQDTARSKADEEDWAVFVGDCGEGPVEGFL